MDATAAGRFLRDRREALQPEDVGLRRGGRRRRTSGLRRDEVAQLADMSSDYLARLERGDGPQPSEQIIAALARALRLTIDERDHLLLLTGYPQPTRERGSTHVSPGLLRILDALESNPAQVMGPIGDTLAQNSTAIALFGDETRYRGPARSAAYRWFSDTAARSLYRPEDHDQHSRITVSQLRGTIAHLGPHSPPAALAQQLYQHNPEFAHFWDLLEIGLRFSEEKHLLHPEVGPISLHCQTVFDPDQHQTLLVFTATPGSQSAEKLQLLTVLGATHLGSDP